MNDIMWLMRGLEVYLNAEKLCIAGVSGEDALTASIEVLSAGEKPGATLRVAGLEHEMFVVWCDRDLRVGDEVTVRIVNTDVVDAPMRRLPSITGPDAEPNLEM